MISISIIPLGYLVKVSEPGTGWKPYSVKAKSIAEVHTAIDHYYGKAGHAQSPINSCPLCALVAKVAAYAKDTVAHA